MTKLALKFFKNRPKLFLKFKFN